MRKRISLLLALVQLFAAFGICNAGAAEATDVASAWREFYVSPMGDDSAAGTKEAPFATIERAKQAVGEINDEMQGDIIVNIEQGEYELEDTLHFTAADSGKNGYNIIYRGNKQQPPKISGGSKISGFRLYDKDKNIFVADAPQFDTLRSIYVNGERRYMAQTNLEIYPLKIPDEINTDAYFEKYPDAPRNGYTYYDPDTVYQYDGLYASKSDIGFFENPQDMEFYWINEYREFLAHVQEVKQDPYREDAVIITLRQNAYDYTLRNAGYFEIAPVNGSGFWIRNAYELLDTPGEYYFNKHTKQLFYMPFDDEDMSKAEVVGPRLEKLISLTGNSMDDRVEHISFEYLDMGYTALNAYDEMTRYTFQATYTTTPENYYIDAAIRVVFGDFINFKGNVIHSLEGSGILFQTAVFRSNIDGNCFYDIGGAAVHVGMLQDRDDVVSLKAERYPLEKGKGKKLNLLNDIDSFVNTSYSFGTPREREARKQAGMLYNYDLRNIEYMHNNSIVQSFMLDENWDSVTGAWVSDPYGAQRGEKAWVRYDVHEKYSFDEITLKFDPDYVTDSQKSNYEVLLSNDRFFKEGNYVKVAEQTEPAAELVTYKVDTDEKYRFIMIRKTDLSQLALTYAAATTDDRPIHGMNNKCNRISITNNYVERAGVDSSVACGIVVGFSENTVLEHNYLKDIAYSGMHIGWGWGQGSNHDSVPEENGVAVYPDKGRKPNGNALYNNGLMQISYNRVDNSAIQANDGGGIYTLGGFQLGTNIDHNYVSQVKVGINAYYFDNGSCRINAFNNVAEDYLVFASANYDGKPNVDFYVYNNYGTNSGSRSVTDDKVADQEVFAMGQYPEEAYNTKSIAGLENGYEYLMDFVPDGYFIFSDDDIAIRKEKRIGFGAQMAEQAVEMAQNMLTLGKYGSGLGEFPYETYHKIEKKLAQCSNSSSLTSSDVYDLRCFLNEMSKTINRYSVEDTLSLCEKFAQDAKTYENAAGAAEGEVSAEKVKALRETVESVKAETENLQQIENPYKTLTALESAYNDCINSRISNNIEYIYADGMNGFDADPETRTIVMYFDSLDGLTKTAVYAYASDGAKVADSFNGVNLADGIFVPVYNDNTKSSKVWSVSAKVGKKETAASANLNKDSFDNITSVKNYVSNQTDGVLVSNDSNAAVSNYHNENNGFNTFRISPVSASGHSKFSVLLGVNSDSRFVINSGVAANSYFKAEFENGFLNVYSMPGSSKATETRRLDIKDGEPVSISYKINKLANSTMLDLYVNKEHITCKVFNMKTDGDDFAVYSVTQPLLVTK